LQPNDFTVAKLLIFVDVHIKKHCILAIPYTYHRK